MNTDIKRSFEHIKPVCDIVMVCPTAETISTFVNKLNGMKKEAIQDLQQYIMFPFITHIKSTEIEKNYELQRIMADAMKVILEKIKVNSFEMCMKIETGLLSLIFDNSKPGMIAAVPEELKLSITKCLTALMLHLEDAHREKLLRTQVPLIAQAVFVCVHLAKLERMRALRLSALHCLMAHTCTHPSLPSSDTKQAADTMASILPGVMAALQDVATCTNNPGHAIIVAALQTSHRVLCLVMNDKNLPRRGDVTARDFAAMLRDKAVINHTDVSAKEVKPKNILKQSPEWYAMAGEKLLAVTQSLVVLRTHEHYAVRKELAVFCHRMLNECTLSMQPSIPLALDVLISLSKDDYPQVSEYCTNAVNDYFATASEEARGKTLDCVVENFLETLSSLPRILNNIDSSRKLSALNLVHGYMTILRDGSKPQRLTSAVCASDGMARCCAALTQAAALDPQLCAPHATRRDLSAPPPTDSPWLRFRHVDCPDCVSRLRDICHVLSGAECAELVVDALLDMFKNERSAEVACIMNWMGEAAESSASLSKRILDSYIEEDVWYSPLEVGSGESGTQPDTMDLTVYNPRAWVKDSVPELYEGAIETRYTDISYAAPRTQPPAEPGKCRNVAEARANLTLSCVLVEGVGLIAKKLRTEFQSYLLKTLCLVLERVGSRYEFLHLAGLKAITDIAAACGHTSVSELIRENADYFTFQVNRRLKKAWNCQSALQILSVVMEYSDATMLDCFYGIVQDVLVQSCDKFHEKDLESYLQVFLTFIQCIAKWFPETSKPTDNIEETIDITQEATDYMKKTEEAERLMSEEEFERSSGKSVEEMYREDVKKKEDNVLDYDDRVTEEKQPLPQHVIVTITILKRCIHFISSKRHQEAILTLEILAKGLPILSRYEDELLPLVHQTWTPLVEAFDHSSAVAVRALRLLHVEVELAGDFLRSRALKDILPKIYTGLHKSAKESYLKDTGSAYRNSPAYRLQLLALEALPHIVVGLVLEDEPLDQAMECVDAYLSNKQPKPLQELAVKFYKFLLEHDYGATWHHLRSLCNNDDVLEPPPSELITLKPVKGTPFRHVDKDYENNIKLIFDRE